jgi:adenylyltransferase/sulfurtransferase
VILDCTDNPATRYLISDACVLLGKPLVSASALRTDGQLSVLNYPPAPPGQTTTITKLVNDGLSSIQTEVPAGGPCYRCIWPTPPPPSAVQTCGEGGILGPVVGTMGVLQALEAIKILSASQPMAPHPSQMLLFSSYPSLSFRSVRLRPRKVNCAACSASATITKQSLTSGSLDYVAFCGGLAGQVEVLPSFQRLLPKEFLQAQNSSGMLEVTTTDHANGEERTTAMAAGSDLPIVVDIREKPLYDICHIRDSVNLPYSKLSNIRDKAELPQLLLSRQSRNPELNTLLICARGNDSQYGALKLRELLDDLGHGTTRQTTRPYIMDVAGGWAALKREPGVSEMDWPDV